MHLEVQSAGRVGELRQESQRPGACVQRNLGRVLIHHETVVDIRFRRMHDKWLRHIGQRELLHLANGDSVGVNGQVLVGEQLCLGAFDRRAA